MMVFSLDTQVTFLYIFIYLTHSNATSFHFLLLGEPIFRIDFGKDVAEVIYAAYAAAEEGKRILFKRE
jgi:hypothetical protein